MGITILGTGSCLPSRIVTNEDIAEKVDTSDEWITTRTGIRTRRISGANEKTFQLATVAAKKAIEMAKCKIDEIDIIIVGTITPHMSMPSCACFVQKEIGANKAFAYDINAACSGFVFALDQAEKYILADKKIKILVVGAETLSSRTNWQDRNTCILFGDGAGAVVLGYENSDRGIVGSKLFSDGRLWELLHMHAPKSNNPDLVVEGSAGVHIAMEGREVFKHAVKAMENAILTLLREKNVSLEQIKLVVPHQANIRILNKLKDRLAIDSEKIFINVHRYGNTSAASIPIALDEANRQNKLEKNDLVLICSFGGGFTWGASIIRW